MARGGRGAAVGRAPGRGVGELLLERLQRGLGRLDLLLEPLGLAALVLRRRAPGARGGLLCRSRLRGLRALGGALVLDALLADAQVLRPSRRGRNAARRSSTATVRVPTASSSARSCVISSTEPSKCWSAASSASRLSRSRWFVGSSRIRTFAPEWTRIASDSRRRSPPERPVDRLLGRLAGEQELAEQRARLGRRQPRRALGGLEHGRGRVELLRRAGRARRA